MNEGYFYLQRKLIGSDLWLNEPFTRGQAWVDLIALASFQDGEIRVRGVLVPVKRGQVSWSEVKLAERWKWSRGKVRRFISELKIKQQIVQQTGNVTTLITITNYELYQSSGTTDSTANGTTNRTASSTANGQQTVPFKEKISKVNEGNTTASDDDGDCYLTKRKRKLSGKRLETFNRFWDAFSYRKDKAQAADAWMDIPQLTNALVDEICKAAEVEAQNRHALIQSGGKPKYAQGWLTCKRWEDEQEDLSTGLTLFEQADQRKADAKDNMIADAFAKAGPNQ